MRRLSNSRFSLNFPLRAKFPISSQVTFTLAFLAVAACNRHHTARAESPVAIQRQPESMATLSREVKDVFERCGKAVVKIEATDQHGELSGSGFFIDPMGTLYTAYSVGGEAENINVEFKGKKYPARQLMADLRSGIAMLKVDLASPVLPIGNSEQLEI